MLPIYPSLIKKKVFIKYLLHSGHYIGHGTLPMLKSLKPSRLWQTRHFTKTCVQYYSRGSQGGNMEPSKGTSQRKWHLNLAPKYELTSQRASRGRRGCVYFGQGYRIIKERLECQRNWKKLSAAGWNKERGGGWWEKRKEMRLEI